MHLLSRRPITAGACLGGPSPGQGFAGRQRAGMCALRAGIWRIGRGVRISAWLRQRHDPGPPAPQPQACAALGNNCGQGLARGMIRIAARRRLRQPGRVPPLCYAAFRGCAFCVLCRVLMRKRMLPACDRVLFLAQQSKTPQVAGFLIFWG